MNKTRKITLIGILTAVAIVGRLALQGIPNVQPATIIIILTGVVFGRSMGATLGFVIATVSGLITGIGIWTPFQVIAWTLVGFISGYVPRNRKSMLFAWSIMSAFVYGFISSLSMLFFIPLSGFFTAYMAGIYFDAYHAIGNIIFLAVASPILFKIFDSYKDKCGTA